MSVLNKVMIFLGLKKNSNVVKEETTVQCEEFKKIENDEKGYDNDQLDEQTKKVAEQIPEMNITPIPNFKENEVDLESFDKEVEKAAKTDVVKPKRQHKKKPVDASKQELDEKPAAPKKKRTYKKKTENTKKEA